MPSKKNNYSTFLLQVEKPDFTSRYLQISSLFFTLYAIIKIVIKIGGMIGLQFWLSFIGLVLMLYSVIWITVTQINCNLGKLPSSKITCNNIGLLWLFFIILIQSIILFYILLNEGIPVEPLIKFTMPIYDLFFRQFFMFLFLYPHIIPFIFLFFLSGFPSFVIKGIKGLLK